MDLYDLLASRMAKRSHANMSLVLGRSLQTEMQPEMILSGSAMSEIV
jgi:hypothetical protein